ncbi:MAG: fibronectin type III domain-containing protein [Armatimonadetes bacterium]|jgi:hypothetical protein|nr:fibronectin type III domain-containing protein [Armatimonadota bacterium]MDI9585676.1 fibronectin type III domain-containing protein [Acidobacteriota bacterium]
MTAIRTSWWGRHISYALLATMVLGLTPLCAGTADAQGRNRTVLLFSVSDESASGLPELRKVATDSLQMAIDQLAQLECTEFSRTSPLVRRAAAEGRVLPTQLELGPSNPRDAVAIGHALNVDTVVLASIQSYRSTQQPRAVEVIISGQAYDVKPNYDEEAGDPVAKPQVAQAFGVVGTSRKLPGYQGSDRPLAREAIDEAAYRVARVLSGATISEVAKPTPKAAKKSSGTKILAYLAAVGLLAYLVSESGGDDATGPSPDAVPPTVLPLQVEGTDTIRLRWQEPTGTSFTVLRYQIQRRVNNGEWSFFGSGGSSADVSRTATEYPDFGVTTGNSYSYRMRVIYTNQKVSEWVMFQGITL